MNKLILAAVLLFAGQLSSSAANRTNNDPILITIPGAITSLVINEGITVVLTNDNTKAISVSGGEQGQNPLKLELSSGKLTLTRKKTSPGEKLVVYVPAAGLRSVSINGESELTGNALLPLAKLDIAISGECKISIRTTGKVNIITWDDIEFKKGIPAGK